MCCCVDALVSFVQEAGKAVHEDVDVAAERQRVEGGGADNDSLCLRNLHKAYKSKVPHTCPLQVIWLCPAWPLAGNWVNHWSLLQKCCRFGLSLSSAGC